MTKSATQSGAAVSAEQIGYLAAGPGRAAEVALARLIDGGLVRISREGLVSAVHQNGHGATTAVEASILAGLNGAARPITYVLHTAASSSEMNSLRAHLVDRRWIRTNHGRSPNTLQFRAVLYMAAAAGIVYGFFVPDVWYVASVCLFIALLIRNPKRVTLLGRSLVKHADRNARGRVDAVALRGFRGKVGNQWVAAMYGLPPNVAHMVPAQHRKRKTKFSSSASSCSSNNYTYHDPNSGSSCSSSGCSSSSCSSSSCGGGGSSCSSSSSS